MKRTTYIFSILIGLGALGLAPLSAQAETTECTVITSLPYQINTQGVYCLKSKLSTGMITGNAIEITVNNVTLDLNGFKIGGLAAGAGTTAIGIYALQRKNITIKNGIIRGFYKGIYLEDFNPYTTSQGHLIEDIRADQNTFIAIQLRGAGNVVRNCNVVSTGGSAVTATAFGILSHGLGTVISNNTVIDTVEQAGGTGYAIWVGGGKGIKVESNHIANSSFGPGTTSYGIYVSNSAAASVDNNNIVSFRNGVFYFGSTGIYRGNLVSGWFGGGGAPFTGGSAVAGTNVNIP